MKYSPIGVTLNILITVPITNRVTPLVIGIIPMQCRNHNRQPKNTVAIWIVCISTTHPKEKVNLRVKTQHHRRLKKTSIIFETKKFFRMKMVLDELMFRGPAKAVKKKINNHPSNGFDQLLNFVKKTWPTHFLVARSDYNVRLLSQTKTVCFHKRNCLSNILGRKS